MANIVSGEFLSAFFFVRLYTQAPWNQEGELPIPPQHSQLMLFCKKVIVLWFCNARLKLFSVSFALSLPFISRVIYEQLGPAKSNLNLQLLPNRES